MEPRPHRQLGLGAIVNADISNAVGLVLVLGLAMVGAMWAGAPVSPTAPTPIEAPEAVGDGLPVDARGVAIAPKAYQHIVSLHTVADHLLLQLVERKRIAGITAHTQSTHPTAWKFDGIPTVASSDDPEAILALQPDLVVTSNFAAEATVARLRDAGIPVFDLGELRGVDATLEDISVLGALVLETPRAKMLRDTFQRELDALRHNVDASDRVPGLWLTLYGDAIYGGTAGTSYADMLLYGGIHDIAADHGYTAWPRYSAEDVLEMRPQLVVTQAGMAPSICSHDALQHLPACGPGGRVIEAPAGWESDPGLGIVQAAAGLLAVLQPSASP